MKDSIKRYVKKGLLMGAIVGIFSVVLQLITSMFGIEIIYNINFIAVYLTNFIIGLFNVGEAYFIFAIIIFIPINIIFYSVIGGIIGMIYSIFKK